MVDSVARDCYVYSNSDNNLAHGTWMAYTSEIDKLERRHRENPKGRTFAPLADAYRKAGDIPRALEYLKAGLELHPDYLSASIVLGRCHLDLGDLAAAESAFRRVLDLDKENVIGIKALADITERQARFDESEHWLNYLLSIDGSNEEARLQLQRLAGARDQHSQMPSPLAEAETISDSDLETVEIAPVEATRSESEPEPEPEPEPEEEPEPEAEPEPQPQFGRWEAEPAAASKPEPEPEPDLLVEDLEVEEEDLAIVRDERREKASTDFVLEEDPMDGPPSREPGFDVGVERHEEIVLRPSSTSEFQTPSDAELLGGGTAGGATPRFEEDAPAPPAVDAPDQEPVEAVAPEDLWQAHPEDATGSEVDTREEPPVPTPEPVGETERDQAPESQSDAEAESETAATAPAAMELAEPMVTETIGDVYAAQGHVAQALDVYRQLLARSPNDHRLGEKIAELESRPPADAHQHGRGFAASQTGGRSVRSYFGDLLTARLPDSNGAPESQGEAAAMPETSPGVMEEAFQGDDEAPVSGEPTRPASGPLSLSAIFGEDSSPVPPVVSGPDTEEAKPPTSHFDEFFGERPSQPTTTRARSVRLDSDQDDLEQFHKWLKGLKR